MSEKLLDEFELLEVKQSVEKIDKFMDKVDWLADKIKEHFHNGAITFYFLPKMIFWSLVDSVAARKEEVFPILRSSSRLTEILDLEEE